MIQLNYRDSRPIYEQVRDGLRRLVVSGAISPGDKLPSVRQLAASLAINPNTIQRAYEALEQEGYVYSVPGKGSFAAHRTEMDGRRREELLRQLDAIAEELRFFGVTAEDIARRFSQVGEAPAEKGERESHD
jgi:GntR family transcriptional regulator